MEEKTLQALSRALTLLCFRSGAVERLHAEEAILDDKTMEILNRDVNNRIYTVLSAWFGGNKEEQDRLEQTINFLAKHYGLDWDAAQLMEILM